MAATRMPSAPHTEKDFSKEIRSIHRPVHTKIEAERMQAACPDLDIRPDADADGTIAYVPVSRNQAAKRQLFKYLGLEEGH